MPTRRVFQGFTLVELLIVISIIGTLVAMLLPAINSARERGRQTVCSARMQQIGIALAKATANKRGTTRSVNGEPVSLLHPSLLQPNPNAADEWQRKGTLAAELQEVEDVWKCPSAMPGSMSFGFNERLGWMGSRDGGRIAIVEYNTNTLNNEQSVVQVVGTPLTDIWDNDDGSWDTNDRFAPRHFEMANVFTHGQERHELHTGNDRSERLLQPVSILGSQPLWLNQDDLGHGEAGRDSFRGRGTERPLL